MTKIMACNCKHEYQDTKYGAGKRLCNAGGGKGAIRWVCTVCGTKKDTTFKK